MDDSYLIDGSKLKYKKAIDDNMRRIKIFACMRLQTLPITTKKPDFRYLIFFHFIIQYLIIDLLF